MNPLMINNNHHGVGLATNTVAPNSNKTTLFLGDLSAFCSERDIHEIFSPYGEVLEIKIMRSEETNRNLSYGFIKFATHNSAKRALNGLHGVLFCGRNLR
jgi:RNA recognition motif-containing protein